MDDTSGHSVGHIAAKSILCEFARESSIVGSSFSSSSDIAKHYLSVLKELEPIDANFARTLDNCVRQHEPAWAAAARLIDSLWRRASGSHSVREEHLMTLETYA